MRYTTASGGADLHRPAANAPVMEAFVKPRAGAGARTLEAHWYNAADVFERERERIFARDWVRSFLVASGMKDGVPLESRMVSRSIDHSYVQRLVDERQITEEEANSHPQSNLLTGCLGTFQDPPLSQKHIDRLEVYAQPRAPEPGPPAGAR